MATALGITISGATPKLVEVEADLLPGIPDIKIIGLPDILLRELKEKIRSSIRNSGFLLPPRKTIIHMMPTSLPKTGAGLELTTIVAILYWQEKLASDVMSKTIFFGGVSLSGDIIPAYGILPAARWALKNNFYMVISSKQLNEISWIKGLRIATIDNLSDLPKLTDFSLFYEQKGETPIFSQPNESNINEIKGQKTLKKTLALAASGRHHLLLAGPPGCGKTMAANAIQSILSPPKLSEWIEIASIYSLYMEMPGSHCFRPFRAPHHSASHVALVGGGSPPNPGEITRAHYGILFLDELLEFSFTSIGALREPLSEGNIVISRARQSISLPAQFQFIGAFNPCACGNLFSTFTHCNCPSHATFRKLNKLDRPFLDRIDLQLIVESEKDEITHPLSWWQSKVRESEIRQEGRNPYKKMNGLLNANEVNKVIGKLANSEKGNETLKKYIESTQLSGRSEARISRVALTIMDWEESGELLPRHIDEAIHFQMISDWLAKQNKESFRKKVC